MNNARRKKLEGILEKLEDIQGDLEAIGEEEMDYLSNMPEALQSSERGDRASEATASLEEAATSIDGAIESINESTG